MPDETVRPWWRPRRRRIIAAAAVGSLLVGLVLWGQRDTSPVGHFVSAEAKDDFVTAYDDAMRRLPQPEVTRDIRTSHGMVRVYRFTGADDATPPLVLIPGRSSSTPLWADNLPSLLQHRSVYTIDMIGEAGMSIQDKPIADDRDSAWWLHEVLTQLPEPKLHLLGLSIGGWTTANLLRHYPDKVASATLLDPVFTFGNMSLEAVVRSIPASVRWLPKSWRDSFASWTAGGADIENTPEARLIESGMQNYALKLPGPSVIPQDSFTQMDVPVLAVIAGESPMHDSEEISATAKDLLGQTNVKVYPEASHAINGEYPKEIAADVHKFAKHYDS